MCVVKGNCGCLDPGVRHSTVDLLLTDENKWRSLTLGHCRLEMFVLFITHHMI